MKCVSSRTGAANASSSGVGGTAWRPRSCSRSNVIAASDSCRAASQPHSCTTSAARRTARLPRIRRAPAIRAARRTRAAPPSMRAARPHRRTRDRARPATRDRSGAAARARQVAQVGERAAAEAVEPARIRTRIGQQHARQPVERTHERHLAGDAAPDACTGRHAREQPRATPGRCGGQARRIAERRERRAHLSAQRRQAAEQAQARADVDDQRGFVVERDARRKAQQRERDRAQRIGLARGVAFDEPRVRREREHAAALHARAHALPARGRIGDQHDTLLEHRAACFVRFVSFVYALRRAVRRRRGAHVERQARQMDAEQDAHSGSPRWATAGRARAARRVRGHDA